MGKCERYDARLCYRERFCCINRRLLPDSGLSMVSDSSLPQVLSRSNNGFNRIKLICNGRHLASQTAYRKCAPMFVLACVSEHPFMADLCLMTNETACRPLKACQRYTSSILLTSAHPRSGRPARRGRRRHGSSCNAADSFCNSPDGIPRPARRSKPVPVRCRCS